MTFIEGPIVKQPVVFFREYLKKSVKEGKKKLPQNVKLPYAYTTTTMRAQKLSQPHVCMQHILQKIKLHHVGSARIVLPQSNKPSTKMIQLGNRSHILPSTKLLQNEPQESAVLIHF